MNTDCLYHIQIRGQIDENEINEMSPIKMVRDWMDTAVTQFSIQAAQSGLTGLMRHLHNRGLVFKMINCESHVSFVNYEVSENAKVC